MLYKIVSPIVRWCLFGLACILLYLWQGYSLEALFSKEWVPYKNDTYDFSITYPPNWQRTESAAGFHQFRDERLRLANTDREESLLITVDIKSELGITEQEMLDWGRVRLFLNMGE